MTTTPDLWRTPFLDNVGQTGDQQDGVVAATNSNQFFVAWEDRDPGLTAININARSFDSLGNPLTGDRNLTLDTDGLDKDCTNPAAVRLPIAGQGDGLAVAFEFAFSGTDHDIYLVRTNSALTKLEDFIIIDDSGNFEHDPSITFGASGSLWVAYTRDNTATDSDVLARQVDSAGNVITFITLFDQTNARGDHVDLTTLANGNFVAVFQVGPTNDHDIFFTIKSNAGDNVVSPTPVVGANDPTGVDERDAHVAALADGGFVVTWTDEGGDQGGTSNGIRATVYDATGHIVQSNILVNVFNQDGGQFFSDVAALPDGGFIVTWDDNNTQRAQRFDEAGNLVGTPVTVGDTTGVGFFFHHTDAATYSDGRAIFTLNVATPTDLDVQTGILDTRITDANQTTGENFFGAGGGPGDLFLIRDIGGGIPVRQLEAIQTNGTATVFGTVGTNQNFVGSGDFNGDGLSDLLINVDNPANGTRTFLVDQMNPGGIQAQFQIAVRGADWIVDAIADFNHNGTSDILEHHDVGFQRTLEVSVMNNNAVQSNVTIAVQGTNWDVDGTGDFNHDGTNDILQHQIDLSNGSMTLRALSMDPNAVQVQSAPTLGTIGAIWQVDGTGDFNHDGTSDILVHQDTSNGVRTFQVLTIQNNAVVAGTTIAVVGNNISVGGIGDFNGDGTSDFLVHQDAGTTRTDIVYNVVNNAVVGTQTIAVTGIDWHVA
jgi:hypothetical protein